MRFVVEAGVAAAAAVRPDVENAAANVIENAAAVHFLHFVVAALRADVGRALDRGDPLGRVFEGNSFFGQRWHTPKLAGCRVPHHEQDVPN